MNRRGFLKFLGEATIGAGVVYSFPSLIKIANIAPAPITGLASAIEQGYEFSGFVPTESQINFITRTEIFPKIIEDFWFAESPYFARLRSKTLAQLVADEIVNAEPLSLYADSKLIN